MFHHSLLLYVPLLGALVWAAIEDIRCRRIRNELTFALVLTGLIQSFLPMHTVTPLWSLAGLGVGFGLTFLLFALGALGGGDVKLLSGIGAWVGPWLAFEIFVLEAIVGLLVVIAQSIKQRRVKTLIRNSTVLTLNLVHANELGMDHVTETGQSSRSVDKPLPYAVPVLVATIVVVGRAGMGL
jgi:prepilin peptidase CpaA